MLHVDLILYNANVYTMDKKHPKAQAIAVIDKRICAVGANVEILKLRDSKTKTIDLKGKTVLPGFTDCHNHLSSYAHTLEQTDLRNVTSIKQLQQKIKQAATKKPQNTWIIARGFDHEKFKEKRLPTRFDLDKAAPNHAVLITRVCGHLSVASSRALEIANITKHEKLYRNEKIVKDPQTGEPTGVLLEDAQDLVAEAIPSADEEELTKIYAKACRKAAENGLTCVHWLVGSSKDIRIIQKLRKQNKLPIHVYLVIPIEYLDDFARLGLSTSFGDEKVKIGCIKIFADGSLGAYTAALQEPYADNTTTKGILVHTGKKLEKLAEKVHEADFQLAIHAIGDRAVQTALEALERVLKRKPKENHHHRIEHASVLNKELIEHMKKLDVTTSVQPHFIVSDFWVTKRLGERRARWTYPLKTLVESGLNVCAGSDCPVESISPLLGIWAAATRKTFPEERLTVDQAIRMYTKNAAFASFEEDIKGSIEPEKLADLTILSKDPYKIAAEKIKDINVDMTILDGEIVHARKH